VPPVQPATHVLDTRPAGDDAVRRRRECEGCGERFTTWERVDLEATELERKVVEFVRSLGATPTVEEATR
jgi:transcriptional regulator NrdR family protein